MQEEISTAVSSMVSGVDTSVKEMTAMLKEATAESAKNMLAVSQRFEESIVKLRESVSAMSELSSNTKTVMGDLEKLLQAIRQTQEDLATSAAPIQDAANKMCEASENTKDVSENIAKTGELLRSGVEEFNSTQLAIKQSWKEYEDRFSGIDQAVAAVFTSLEDGLDSYNKQTTKYVLDLDAHATKVVTTLASAVSELDESIEDLAETLGHKQAA
jgi:chromosome segregation ATPase